MDIKLIRNIGLFMFIVGFGLFNYAFFMNDYKLTEEIVETQLSSEELTTLFNLHGDGFINETYSSNFTFVSKIRGVIEEVNQDIFDKYDFSENDLQSLVSLFESDAGYKINFDLLDQLYNQTGNSVDTFKKASFNDFAGHLNGMEFSDKAELESALTGFFSTVRKYGTLNKVGIDRYKARDLRYEMTKKASFGPIKASPVTYLLWSYLLCIIGGLIFIIPAIKAKPAGIDNNGIFKNAMTNVGWLGILTGTYLIVFYIFLYFFPEYMTSWIIMVDPVSMMLNGGEAGRFFLYGFLYTLVILVMGVRMLIKYRHSRYQIARTISVMFFQTAFAFLIPEILIRLNQPYYDFKNIWPLDYDFFFDYELNNLIASGGLGLFMLFWGIVLIIIGVPVFVYFFGKRWYCSWVCGCGGLAETLGDPYRQLSDKSVKAWKIERYMVHGVLVFAILMTAGVLYTFFTKQGNVLGISTYFVREYYGLGIGSVFAGVVGTGFYPLMGNRVWCRFGCPLAAYLGIVQRFKSRFRITTNGGQCISCGNCSTYCEMGIDVRWYAQRGQNIVRSSCVGCGVCSAVCPRGVLNLENRDEDGRFNQPILIGNDSFTVKP